jgi:septum formation protein
MGLPSPLILGSGSFTRKLILKEMGIDYILKVRPIDEKGIGDRSMGSDPKRLVSTLAKAKGDYLIQGLLDPNIVNGNMISSSKEENIDSDDVILHEKFDLSYYKEGDECIVLTADQVVTHANAILEKPKDILEAKAFVERYADSPPATVGAVVLTHLPSMVQVSGVDTATIHFKETVKGCNLIERLLEDDAPVLDCAGGLMVEHPLVKEHISKIDGTEDSVMGLSKDLVLSLLQSLKEKLENHNKI